jgi:hypothetical protein
MPIQASSNLYINQFARAIFYARLEVRANKGKRGAIEQVARASHAERKFPAKTAARKRVLHFFAFCLGDSQPDENWQQAWTCRKSNHSMSSSPCFVVDTFERLCRVLTE